MSSDYANKKLKEYTLMLRTTLAKLPPYCAEFFRGIENETLIRTRYAYAGDLMLFFKYLCGEIERFSGREITSITLDELNTISVSEIEMYLEYISYYSDCSNNEKINNDRAKARKLASVRAFYKYFYKKEKLTSNSPALVDLPTIREKAIIRLEPDEVAKLLDAVESGEGLSDKQKAYHSHTQKRDIAILTLFLGTGIRISELVGIDIDDINFTANEFSIIRKGGNQDILVFGDEARSALLSYMLERENIEAVSGHENALFLSLQRTRLTVRAVENIVKKYAKIAVPLKKISPHKLRSTYGTMLYRETGDIYLVADVLGHKDVNTTRKHYAAISEDRRRIAAKVIKLRDD